MKNKYECIILTDLDHCLHVGKEDGKILRSNHRFDTKMTVQDPVFCFLILFTFFTADSLLFVLQVYTNILKSMNKINRGFSAAFMIPWVIKIVTLV